MDNSQFTRRIVSRLSGVALLVALVGLLAGCINPLEPGGIFGGGNKGDGPGPSPFVWREVTPAPATPQEAFTTSISQLRLCISSRIPARSVTAIWLTSGPTYGVVLLLADCSNQSEDTREGIAILPITLDKSIQPKCPAWVLGNGGMVTRKLLADANLGQMAYQIPSWLPLPPDAYMPETMGGGIAPSALFSLESSTRLFIAGRFEGSATRPAGAATISIGGRSGWQVTDHDIVTVTIPLADGWTFFFSGTADATVIRRLASASLSHLDALLPHPVPTPTDYPRPTPAC